MSPRLTGSGVRFRPLGVWPWPETSPRRSRHTFKAPWSSTVELLERELAHLHAHHVVIQADFADDDIRLDGWPRAGARAPAHPGVIVSFESDHGPLRYATDTHEWWQHNVRAIALGLEALRAVDRYGVTRSGEQYRGWNALPSGDPDLGPLEVAATLILRAAGTEHNGHYTVEDVIVDPAARSTVIRAALKRSHPDGGGDEATFEAVQRARRLLEAAP